MNLAESEVGTGAIEPVVSELEVASPRYRSRTLMVVVALLLIVGVGGWRVAGSGHSAVANGPATTDGSATVSSVLSRAIELRMTAGTRAAASPSVILSSPSGALTAADMSQLRGDAASSLASVFSSQAMANELADVDRKIQSEAVGNVVETSATIISLDLGTVSMTGSTAHVKGQAQLASTYVDNPGTSSAVTHTPEATTDITADLSLVGTAWLVDSLALAPHV